MPPKRGKGVISVETLLNRAEERLDEYDHAGAKTYLVQAVKQAPNNLKALEMLAGVNLEMGDVQKAVERLTKCIQLAPNTGHSKYLTIGQLSEGKSALSYFKKGIEILEKERDQKPEHAAKFNRVISSVYCSMTDVYLTDLCYDDDAEQRCCNFLDQAMAIDPTNPEVYQVYASVRISQTRNEDAKALMDKSLDLWLPLDQKRKEKNSAANGEVEASGEAEEEEGEEEEEEEEEEEDQMEHDDEEEGEEGEEEEEEEAPGGFKVGEAEPEKEEDEEASKEELDIPSYDFRINSAKLLVELEEHEKASKVLELLLVEDDEVVEVWYLLGYVYTLMKERKSATTTLKKAAKLFVKVGCDDKGIFEHIQELLAECKTFALKPGEEEGDDEEEEENGEFDDEEGEDWEEYESSDEDVEMAG